MDWRERRSTLTGLRSYFPVYVRERRDGRGCAIRRRVAAGESQGRPAMSSVRQGKRRRCATMLKDAAGGLRAQRPVWRPPPPRPPPLARSRAHFSKPGRGCPQSGCRHGRRRHTVALWRRQNTFNSSYSLQIFEDVPPAGPSPRRRFLAEQFHPTAGGQLQAAKSSPPGSTSKTRRGSTRFRSPPAPPGAAAFGPPVTAYTAAPSVLPQDLQLAVGPNGDIALTWNVSDPDAEFDKVVGEIDPEFGPPCTAANPAFRQGDGAVRRAAPSPPRNGSP